MGKKKKAKLSDVPDYANTTYSTGGLFGSSTTNKEGTSFKPTGWMSDTMGTVGGNLNNTLSAMVNNDFTTDPNFQRYQDQFNNQMTQAYDTDVLSQLANRGLMRSSGLQSATNAFADTLANNQMNLYDNYYNRQANNLSNLLNTSNTIYNYLTGVNAGSQNNSNNISNYNLAQTQANNQIAQMRAAQAGGNGWSGALSGALNGAMAGASTGNPYAALGGAVLGGVGGYMKNR